MASKGTGAAVGSVRDDHGRKVEVAATPGRVHLIISERGTTTMVPFSGGRLEDFARLFVEAHRRADAAMPGQPGATDDAAPDGPMAIDGDGALHPVGEFTTDPVPGRPIKWWCDGEECDGLVVVPHVHPMYGAARYVDLLTGHEIEPPATEVAR